MTSNKSTSSPQLEQAPVMIGRDAELGEIIVFIDGHTEPPSILEFACLAEEPGARLIGMFMQAAPKVTTAQTLARGKGIREVMQVQEQEIEEIEAHHQALFEDTLRRHRSSLGTAWGASGIAAHLLRRRTGWPLAVVGVHHFWRRPFGHGRLWPLSTA